MPNEIATYNSTENVVVYSSADNAVHLDVQLADETVWLTQQQIATLFGVQIPAISKHLANIFREGELDKNSVISILENTATDGKKYRTMFYNEETIYLIGASLKDAGKRLFAFTQMDSSQIKTIKARL